MKIRKGKIGIFVVLVVTIFAIVGTTTLPIWNNIVKGLDLIGGFEILYQAEEGQQVDVQVLNDTAAAIRNRVDILGVTEPEITVEPPNRIRVQLAGVKDQSEARDVIGKPAQLTFRDPTGEEILMAGSDLKQNGARVDFNEQNAPVVVLTLNDAKKFEQITREYLSQPMPIYLDDQLLSAPTIRQPIPGGVATIDGQRTVEEAQQLVDLLNAGALPIKLKEVQSFAVDASLGQESLRDSYLAGAYALIMMFVFMIGYYRLPGLVAVMTLITYAYLVLLTFSFLQVTLTLPGIAALILGVGMAVDANILMNERIKEELRRGKSVQGAVRTGAKRSFLTIFDANFTTILVGAVLFYFGTAGVKGFAVSLIVGILISFLTAVLFSRVMINLLVESNLLKYPSWFGVKEDEISDL